MCPPEGDAGTGMAATNAVAERTGNVSAGTSVFAMIVLEKALTRGLPGDRYGHHPRRQARGHGPLQQLHQ